MPASDGEPFIVAVTGGIGCGKSTVAAIFGRLGGHVIDADRIAHQELAESAVIEEIREALGDGVVAADGSLDRAAIARWAFSDEGRRRALEAIIHPRVRARIDKMLAELRHKGSDGGSPLPEQRPLVLLDIPLLETSSFRDAPHEVIFIESSRVERLGRVAKTRGWLGEELDRREAAQTPLEEKRRRAGTVIENPDGEGSLEKVEARCRQLIADWARRLADSDEPGA